MSDPISAIGSAAGETVGLVRDHLTRVSEGRKLDRSARLEALDHVLEVSARILAQLEDFIDTFEKAEAVQADTARLEAAVRNARRWVEGDTRDILVEIGRRGDEIGRLAIFGWRDDWYQSRAVWAWQRRQMQEVARDKENYQAPGDVDRLIAAAKANRPSLKKWDRAIMELEGFVERLLDRMPQEGR